MEKKNKLYFYSIILLFLVIVSTIFVYMGNLIADLIYQYVDPRIRGDDDD
jgi:peptide/nickel transport system permease protein